MTTAQKTAAGAVTAAAIAAAVILAPAPAPTPLGAWPPLKAVWNPVECHGYNVYHGTNLDRRTWQRIGQTTNAFFWFQSQAFGFIGVRAFNRSGTNELESDWALAAQQP